MNGPSRSAHLPIRAVFLASTLVLGGVQEELEPVVPVDYHVHLVSPELHALFRKIGLRAPDAPEPIYCDARAIFERNRAARMVLVSMAYLYAQPGLGGETEYEKVVAENDHVAAQAARFPGRAFGFVSLNPFRTYAAEEILRCAKLSGVHGLKLHFDNSKVSLRVDENVALVRDVLTLASEEGLAVLVHLDDQSPGFGRRDAEIFVEEVLARVPPLSLILAHLGTGGGFDSATREVLEVFAEAFAAGGGLARHDVHFDLSGVVLTRPMGPLAPTEESDAAELTALLRRIGSERLLFATDYPFVTAPEYLADLRSLLSLTEEELDAILDNPGPLPAAR